MVIRPRPSLLELFFILRGSVVRRIFPQILVTAGLSSLVVWAHETRPGLLPLFDAAPFSLLGIALSIFLGFRNNACYDRWWEARRQWGALIAASRQLERQTLVLPDDDGAGGGRPRLLRLAMAFAQSLALHLRSGGDNDKAIRHLTAAEQDACAASRNAPARIARLMGEELARLRHVGRLPDVPYIMLDQSVSDMAGVLTACERISGTPIPFGYTLLLHRTAYLFCFMLPLGFANALGWATPVFTAVAAYAFFGLDTLGDELEDPFGAGENDLPIAALADGIESELREALGETDLPAAPAPKDYLLM